MRRSFGIVALLVVTAFACSASRNEGSSSAVSAACPWDPGFGTYNTQANEWWIDFSVVDTTTATMQIEVAVDGGPSRVIALPYISPDYEQIDFSGSPGDTPIEAGTLVRLTATHPTSNGTQSASSTWFTYLTGAPLLDCPDASAGTDASTDGDAQSDATLDVADATLDVADASDASLGGDSTTCVATWNPSWQQNPSNTNWADYTVSGGSLVPTGVSLAVVGGASYALTYSYGSWSGPLGDVPSGTSVVLHAAAAGGVTAQTLPFPYLVDQTPTTDTCQGAPAAVAVSVSPKTVSVLTGATEHFSAAVTGTTNTSVIWSVQETSGCGSISSAGDYVAPTAVATCHVVATSVADSTKSDVATVTVVTASAGTMSHVSIGKPAFASAGTASLLTDGAYRSPNAWTFSPSKCSTRRPCWAAVHVGAGPSTLLLDWSYQDGEGDFDTRVFGGETLTAYDVLVSANSTDGSNGTWSTAIDALTNGPITVTNNPFIQRSHPIKFTGFSWVKLSITSATANEIDEIDLWDASSTSADSYFFHGDSITTRCANLRGTNPIYGEQPSFQADVQTAHPGHYPLQVGGGIVAQGSADAVSEISGYLSLFRPVKYWFFTMGTNDLCGGASAFSGNAQRWVDAVKAAGGVPILVHPIWANNVASFCYQNGPAFNAAVDALVQSNGLRPAVPLYEATVGHPEYFASGDVHPNTLGCAVWNKTFADAVSSFY